MGTTGGGAGSTSGYRALHESAAWLDLSRRGEIKATGEDRARLLHAMCTNHVQQLTPGAGCYAFFLNAQGRILADAVILCLAGHLLLDTEPETARKLFAHIDRYIIADDVTLEDQTAELVATGVEGPLSAEVLSKAGAPLPENDFGSAAWGQRVVAKVSVTGAAGYRILASAAEKDALVAEIEEAGAVAASPGDARTRRLENGKPRYGDDIFDTTIPQETRQMHAVHFSKGCYLGQEIVERVRSQGHVNKLLSRFRIGGRDAPPSGAKILSGDKEAGEITSAAHSPSLGAVCALGYVRGEFIRPGVTFQVNGVAAELLTGA